MLRAGTIVTAGEVVIPTISASGAPVPNYPDERVELRQDITVGVQGDNEHGWTLSFRAEDGNVYYRVETRVIDNNGREWSLWTNYSKSQGLTLQFDDAYLEFHRKCVEAMEGVIRKYKLVQDVPRWKQVMAVERVIQHRVQNSLRGKEVGAAASLRELLENEPEIAKQLFRMG